MITDDDKKKRTDLFGGLLSSNNGEKPKIIASENGDAVYNGNKCSICGSTIKVLGTGHDGSCIICKRSDHQEYKKRTRPKQNAHSAKRRATKLNQTPPDADFDKIEKIYEEAKRLEKETGEPYHVDHKIPLSKGGQHHQDNLRPIPAEENLRKGARII